MQEISALLGNAEPWLLPALAGAGAALLGLFLIALVVRLIRGSGGGPDSHSIEPEKAPKIVHMATHAMATGNIDTARFALEKFLDRDDAANAGTRPWLILLDIYHQKHDRKKYVALARRMYKTTGVIVPDYDRWHAGSIDSSLKAAHPDLYTYIKDHWPGHKSRELLDGLLVEAPQPGRVPFSPKQMQELLALRDKLLEETRSGAAGKPAAERPAASAPKAPEAKTPETSAGPGKRPYGAPADSNDNSDDGDPLADMDMSWGSGSERRSAKTGNEAAKKPAGNKPPRSGKPCAIEEKHPRLVSRITGLWPTQECVNFIDSLIIDDRGGRQGFDADVMEEVLLLKEMLIELNPGEHDPWEGKTGMR